MTTFQTLFGIDESQVKNTCILMPLLPKATLKYLGVRNFSKGKLYGSGNTKSFTLIHTRISSALLGDAVLYLSDTRAKNLILFGSCGLVEEKENITVGSILAPHKSYSLESFSNMLSKKQKAWDAFYADKTLLDNFLNEPGAHVIQKADCATVSSLKLEEEYIDLFKEKNIQIVDMECSAFFSASQHTGKRAMAIFYVTDIIHKKPFYVNLKLMEKLTILSSIKSIANILCNFIEKNLNC